MDAIIPARGGSKRLPGKNLMEVDRLSMLANAIEAARNSRYIINVVVTTDSDEIAAEARRYCADRVVMRGEELSNDTASAVEAVIHAAIEVGSTNVAMVLPNYPFTNAGLIDRVIGTWYNEDPKGRVSAVTAMPIDPRRLIRSDGEVTIMDDGTLAAAWLSCGAVQVSGHVRLKASRSFHCPATIYVPVNHAEAIEVDTLADLLFARRLAP